MADLINMKVKLDINIDKNEVDFTSFKLVNAEGVGINIIETPEGFDENIYEQWIELVDVDKDVVYENIYIVSEDFEDPIIIGDINIREAERQAMEVAEQEAGYTEDEAEEEFDNTDEVELSNDEEEEEEVQEPVEPSTEIRLRKLSEYESQSTDLEKELVVAREVLGQANEVLNVQEEKTADAKDKMDELQILAREAQAAYDSATASANDPEIDDEVKAQILADAEQEKARLDAATRELEAATAVYEAEEEKSKGLRNNSQDASNRVSEIERALGISHDNEEKLKAEILNDAWIKIERAKKSTEAATKVEHEAAEAHAAAVNSKHAAESARAKSDELFSQYEALKTTIEASEDNAEIKLLGAKAAKILSLAKMADKQSKKLEKQAIKLNAKYEKIQIKADAATAKAAGLSEIARVAEEAAVQIQGMRIARLEQKIESEDLTDKERKSLTQEIESLRYEVEEEDMIVDEITHHEAEVEAVNAVEMSKTEKFVKKRFKKTYWIVYERGARSRDQEFNEFVETQEEERRVLILEIQRKQEEAQAQIEADKLEAAREVETIKANAAADAERAAREAAEEKAKAEAEVAEIKRSAAEAKASALAEAEEAKAKAAAEAAEAKATAEREAKEAKEKAAAELAEAKAAAEAEVAQVKAEGERLIAEQKEEIEAKVKEAERMIEADKARHDEIENGLRNDISQLEEQINGLNSELEKERKAVEAEAEAKAAAVKEIKAALDKAVAEAHHEHTQKIEQVIEEHSKQVEQVKTEIEMTAKEKHDKILAEANATVEKVRSESQANIDDLLRQIAELEAKIEKLEKAKAIADKKMALLQQIEDLVEDDIKG